MGRPPGSKSKATLAAVEPSFLRDAETHLTLAINAVQGESVRPGVEGTERAMRLERVRLALVEQLQRLRNL